MIKTTKINASSSTTDLEGFVREALRLGSQAYTQYTRMWEPSLKLGRSMWDGYVSNLRSGTMGSSSSCGCRPRSTCEVPETCCPPRCVCELAWQANPRDVVRGTVRVTNTGTQTRTFTFVPTALESDGVGSGVTPNLDPQSATLAPGQAVQVFVVASLAEGFEAGRTYTGEIAVRGLYEQCVKLRIDVEPEARPHCDVEQGEMPMRVREHRWSDHFQCEEPCFEPVGRTPNDPVGPNNPTGGRTAATGAVAGTAAGTTVTASRSVASKTAPRKKTAKKKRKG